jgi:hypothetical protein
VGSSKGTGLRRVQWVRVLVDGESTRAEAIGVAHRRPATVPISLRMASRLAAAGVPTVVRHLGTADL